MDDIIKRGKKLGEGQRQAEAAKAAKQNAAREKKAKAVSSKLNKNSPEIRARIDAQRAAKVEANKPKPKITRKQTRQLKKDFPTNKPITRSIDDFARLEQLTQAIVDSPFESSNAKKLLPNLGRRQKLKFVHEDRYSALKSHILARVGFDPNEVETPAMRSTIETIEDIRQAVLSERGEVKSELPINTTNKVGKKVKPKNKKVFGYTRNEAGEIVPLNPYPPEPPGPIWMPKETYHHKYVPFEISQDVPNGVITQAKISSDEIAHKASKASSGLTGELSEVAAAASSSTKKKIAEDTLRAVEVVQSRKLGYAAVAAGAGALVLGIRNRRKMNES
jgi:hypothetical protein